MTHYSVRKLGPHFFAVHADDSGYNVVGYTKRRDAERRAETLNFEAYFLDLLASFNIAPSATLLSASVRAFQRARGW